MLSSESISDHYRGVIDRLCAISEAYYYAGKVQAAVSLLRVGMEIAETGDVRETDRARLLLQYGKLLNTANFQGSTDYALTVSVLERARLIAEGIGDAAQTAAALDLLGFTSYAEQLLTGADRVADALDFLKQAQERCQKIDAPGTQCWILFHTGLIHQNLTEDQEQAGRAFEQGLEIARKHGLRLHASYLVRHLGYLLVDTGRDAPQGVRYLEESLALREEIGFKIYVPGSHMTLAAVYAAQKDFPAAIDHYQKACMTAEEIEMPASMLAARMALGRLHREQGQTGQARACFEQAQALAERIGDEKALAEAQAALAGA